MHTTATLTYVATVYGPNGHARRVAISLPYIASIADDPHYAAAPRPNVLPDERAPRMTSKLIRRALGRDRQQAARALNRVGFERTMRRVEREGV